MSHSVPSRDPPSFAADVMLGKLARWLRMLGCDTFYDNAIDDAALVRIAQRERRILLTRDRGIRSFWTVDDLNNESGVPRPSVKIFLVRSTDPDRQIVEVVKKFDLDTKSQRFSRCMECNALLKPVEKQAVLKRLPPLVILNNESFVTCSQCEKVYWQGTHIQAMIFKLEKLFQD